MAAVPVGFFAGFFGIGGGLISVPFLFFLFDKLNFDQEYLMHLSVGTSFSITILTSLASVLTHKKHKAVDINILKSYGIYVIVGVLFGTFVASLMNTKSMLMFFAFVVFVLGAYLLILDENKKKQKFNFTLGPKVILGFISGFISAPMGITGAMMNVPILRFFGYNISKAIGSAAAIGFIIAVSGCLGFFFFRNILKC